jgi:16S rRNA (adenine1518-N6/adenine1519-N6)-dimethyltransferase
MTKGEVTSFMRRHGLRADKRFGQNFLVDGNILRKIIDAAGIEPNDTVIEVGPGLGVLTRELAARAEKVVSVEIDKKLIAVLEEELAGLANVQLVNGDVMKIDLASFISSETNIVANLPYNITTPFICSVLERGLGIKKIAVMVQKEAAERFTALPGTKQYGAATLTVNCFADVKLAAIVPPNCFYPPPDVTSAVTVFDVLPKPRIPDDNRDFVFELIHCAFAMRRKTLVNCLASSGRFPKQQVIDAVMRMGLDVNIRGEVLCLKQFEMLSHILKATSETRVSEGCVNNLKRGTM